jgi:hypothetical protein
MKQYKAKTVAIIILLALANHAKSQVLIGLLFGDKLNKGPIEFGLNVFENISKTSIDNNSSNRYKFGFGLFMDYKLNENWVVAGSLCFASPKGEKEFDTKDPQFKRPKNQTVDSLIVLSNTERTLNYFELPITFNYRAFGRIGIGFGGYVSMLSKAVDHYVFEEGDEKLTYERSILAEMYRLDYGISGGLHYHFKGNPGAQIRVNYNLGLADLFKDSRNGNGHNEAIQAGVLIPIKFGLTSSELTE